MPTLLLTFFLLLSGNNSCAKHPNKNTLRASSQSSDVLLKSLLEQVDSSDEPALRVFLRLKIAKYLWENPQPPVAPKSMVIAALTDLRAHEKDIPSLYVNLFRRDLIAQLRIHDPETAARLTEEYKLNRRTDLEVAYSMLEQENGVDKAVSIAQRSIIAGKEPERILVPFLHRLEKVNPTEVPKMLDKLLAAEEAHRGSISTGTLFTLKHLFIREQTPQDLQRRYLAVVINRADETAPASIVNTYNILADIMPVVGKQAPDLYYSANARLSDLAALLPKGTLERISINKRVSQSSEPLAQLLAERDAVSDPSLKDDLQIEAAQLALEKGQVRTAIELVAKVQPKNDEARRWRDQFIEGAVGRALDKGDVSAAKYGASQIQSYNIRSSALQKVALYLQGSNDLVSARTTLNSALKLIKASDDNTDKAIALLDLSVSFLKIDSQQASELLSAAVKVINKIPVVLPEVESGSNEHLRNVEDMMKIAYKLIPTFQALSATDERGTLGLATDIQRQELKSAATFGTYTRLSAPSKTKQLATSN
jgi:hypothetical protein